MAKDEKPQLLVSIEVLKKTLRQAVSNAIENFEQDTGITPSSITVEMHEVTRMRRPPGRSTRVISVMALVRVLEVTLRCDFGTMMCVCCCCPCSSAR